MKKRTNTGKLLLFGLCGVVLWLCGNLYEAVVIAPNLLTDSIIKLRHWQAFFTVTNPVFFYIPLSPLAVLAIFISYFIMEKDNVAARKYLRHSLLFLIPALLVGIYIVTQINFFLFFGDVSRIGGEAHRLSVLWNALNAVRIFFLTGAVYNLFNAFLVLNREWNRN